MVRLRFRGVATAVCAGLLLAGTPAAPAPSVVFATARMAAGPVPLSDCVSSDNGNPDLRSITVAPTTVDVREHVAWVTVTVTATDEGGPGPATGVHAVYVYVQETAGKSLQLQPDGSWKGRIRMPPGMESGTHRLSVSVWDGAQNSNRYSSSWLRRHGYGVDINVRSHPVRDRTPPVVRGLTVTPDPVDSRLKPHRVTFSAHVTDAKTGVHEVAIEAYPSSGPGYVKLRLHLHDGTTRDGRWRGTATIARWVGTHPWDVYLTAYDTAKNDKDWYGPKHFLVRSRTDSTKPTIVSAVVSPPAVDVRTADSHYTVRVRARDSRPGLAGVLVWRVTGGEVFPQSLHKVAGTRHDGTWQLTIPVHRCYWGSETYDLRIEAQDRAGNYRLSARMPVTVTSGDHLYPWPLEVTPSRAGPLTPVTYRFTEDIVGISTASAPVRSWESWQGPQPGTWACHTAAGAAVECYTGPVHTATWTPTVPLTGGQDYFVEFNPEHVLDVTDLAGNPIRDTMHVNWTVIG